LSNSEKRSPSQTDQHELPNINIIDDVFAMKMHSNSPSFKLAMHNNDPTNDLAEIKN
jgi:hypothetical protein